MDSEFNDSEASETAGLSRRQIIQRGALLGAVAWTVPVVQTFHSPAGAQVGNGSAPCDCVFCSEILPGVVFRCTPINADGCACLCCCGGNAGSCAQCGEADPCAFEIDCVIDPTCEITV